MPISERLMLPGDWTVTLLDDTPKAIRDKLVFFGHIMILDSPVDVRKLSDASVKASARYAGIVRTEKNQAFTIGGPGLVAWLGNEAGVGAVWETARIGTASTLAQWMAIAVPASIAVSATTHTVAGGLTQSFGGLGNYVTPRTMIDYLMQYFGTEYKIHPDATIEFGYKADLFRTTPPYVIVQRSPGGRDIINTGVSATTMDLEQDADDYSTRVLLFGASSSPVGANAPATPYKDLRGNAVVLTRMVTNSQALGADAAAVAAAEMGKWDVLHTQITLTSDEYDVGRDIAAGDNIWVYDPQRGLIDTTQQTRYRGSVITPMTVRVLSVTWPIERGMGVYYRDLNGVYTDLTPFVSYESPGASLEVGAVFRKT